MASEQEHTDPAEQLRTWFRAELSQALLGRTRPYTFDEYAAGTSVVSITSNAKTSNVCEVHSVLVYVAGASVGSGLLALGNRTFPVPVGLTLLSGLLIQLATSDQRALAAFDGGGAPIAAQLVLCVMGEEIVGYPALSMGRN